MNCNMLCEVFVLNTFKISIITSNYRQICFYPINEYALLCQSLLRFRNYEQNNIVNSVLADD